MGKGQTFLADDETPRGVIKHLRVVISNPAKFDDDTESKYLVVSVTTWYEDAKKQDASCILEAGCHPFIKHKSWIDYSRAEEMTFADIFNGVQRGSFIRKEDMPPEAITHIQEGAKVSDFFPVELECFFQYF